MVPRNVPYPGSFWELCSICSLVPSTAVVMRKLWGRSHIAAGCLERVGRTGSPQGRATAVNRSVLIRSKFEAARSTSLLYPSLLFLSPADRAGEFLYCATRLEGNMFLAGSWPRIAGTCHVIGKPTFASYSRSCPGLVPSLMLEHAAGSSYEAGHCPCCADGKSEAQGSWGLA